MARKILLIEPNYKNKYPPIGLMKIATYHKMLGDEVRFFKGEFKDFILEQTVNELLERLKANDKTIEWIDYRETLTQYVKKGFKVAYDKLVSLSDSNFVKENLKYYRKYYYKKGYLNNPTWDRIYITTLFTFYWKKTIKTINLFKQICIDIDEVKIGGVTASLVPEQIEEETGIKPHIGLLDKSGEYDDNEIIIDHLPLDYSILDEIDYIYPENNAYYSYMTRGCVNKCSFCAVPQLEPKYNGFISIKKQIKQVSKIYGEKRNLLLLDNNVLASKQFDDIIDEIKECGFYAGVTYTEPNKYSILIRELRNLKFNYLGHIKGIVRLYKWLYKKCNDEHKSQVYSTLHENKLLDFNTATKEAIFRVDNFFSPLFEKYRNKSIKKRYVDFNQGVDARFVTPHKMKRLSEIPIRPLRIAFDSWKYKDIYERAIRLAAENNITSMSNYLLYNYDEEPIELYKRLKLNVDLCDELNVNIYSFPMKYHPIQDPSYFKNRIFIGKYWNRKFIRSIQAILNSTKGKVGRGRSFFQKAFGRSEQEFEKLLYMPEAMIVYRFYYEKIGITDKWWDDFTSLNTEKSEKIKGFIHCNDFSDITSLAADKEILNVLKYYTIKRDDAEIALRKIKK